MQQKKIENSNFLDDEINLGKILNILIEKKIYLLCITVFLTLISILYIQNIPSTYTTFSLIKEPSQFSINFINQSHSKFSSSSTKLNLRKLSKESVLSDFLNQITSSIFQKKIFVEGGFVTKFNTGKNLPANEYVFISNILKRISILKTQNSLDFEKKYLISFQGGNPEVISEYLNELINKASALTLNLLAKDINQKITNRISEIDEERNLLIDYAKRERISEIKRIKENDAEKLNYIKNQIERERFKSEKYRLNQLVLLDEALQLSTKLGIIENQFEILRNEGASSNVIVTIGDIKDFSMWYLYGQKAIKERISLLKKRDDNDPYTPELISLQNKINEIENNSQLKTLETRTDDSLYNSLISSLEVESSKLSKHIINFSNINAISIEKVALTPKHPFKPNRRMILITAFIGSFMISIFLTLFLQFLQRKEKTST